MFINKIGNNYFNCCPKPQNTSFKGQNDLSEDAKLYKDALIALLGVDSDVCELMTKTKYEEKIAVRRALLPKMDLIRHALNNAYSAEKRK